MTFMKTRQTALFLALLLVIPAFGRPALAAASSLTAAKPSAIVETDLDTYENNEVLAFYQDGSYQVHSFQTKEALAKGLEQLSQDQQVLLVQPNYTYSEQEVSVNDALLGKQWALSNDGTFQAPDQKSRFPVLDGILTQHFGWWDSSGNASTLQLRSTNNPSTAVAGIDVNIEEAWRRYNGGKRSVIVAMLDTGIDYTHEDLAGAIWVNEDEIPGNGIDDDGNGYIDDVHGWNFYDHTNQVYTGDEDSHGTHGAGTIAASSNNQIGISGIVPGERVKIMPVKALGGSDGSGTTASLIQAIHYAEANGASICNLSLSSSKNDRALYQAIAQSNMLFIVAAGNDSANIDLSPTYPASYNLDNILSVANLCYDGVLHHTSNYGASSVDLAAPGTHILSTTPGNRYSYMTGTSMAAPMVTAAAAMIYTQFDGITLADVKEILLASVKPLASLTGLVSTGGMLDIGAALAYDTSKLSGDNWTHPTEVPSTPTIEAQRQVQDGNLYLFLQDTGNDKALVRAANTSGEYTASAFTKGTIGTGFSFHAQRNAQFFNRKSVGYPFYARGHAGNKVTKMIPK